MRISGKVDYAVRALCELAARPEDGTIPAEVLATAQHIPTKYLKNILSELRAAGIVHTQRGRDGGVSLARPAEEIHLADIIRAVDGPLAAIQGRRPEHLHYEGGAKHLDRLWVAVRASLREVLDGVTLADVVSGDYPARVLELLGEPGAWESH